MSQSAVDVARQQGDQHLEMRHATLVETGLPAQTRKVSMRLQLPASAETLWKDLAAKVRSQVRRGMKERTAIRWGGKELVPVFYRLLAERWRDLGTPLYARSFFDAVMEAFPHQTQEEEAPRAAICLVTLDDKPAAAGLLLGYRSLMEIPWAASRPQFNRQAVNMLLYWSALEFACHRGYEVFDFGRCSPDSGTHRFKAQWGAKPLPLPWAYWTPDGSPPDLNPDNPRYALAIRTWQRLPVAITRLIGPRIAPHLP